MAKPKNKYYAIKKGEQTGIFEQPWDEVKWMVQGFQGAIYKGFPKLEDAETWFNDKPVVVEQDEDTLIAYVDGSFNKDTGEYGCGVVLIFPCGKENELISFSGNNEKAKDMWNVAGELSASMRAMKEAKDRGYSKLIIHHDYEGVAKYCTNEYKAKKEMTKAYANWYENNIKEYVDVGFKWVKGHSNDEFNELADVLAKKSVGIG